MIAFRTMSPPERPVLLDLAIWQVLAILSAPARHTAVAAQSDVTVSRSCTK
jgi:hypothetical protein